MAWSISARCSARSAGCPPDRPRPRAAHGLAGGVKQQQGRGVGEDQRVAQLGCAERAGLGPVHAEHAGPDRPDPQREREDRPGSGLTCRGGEGRPAMRGFRGAKVRGQNGPTGGGRIQRWSFPQGQLELSELVADHISNPYQMDGVPIAGRRQPAASDADRGHGRRARIRGGHVPAPPGRLDGDQAPDPSRPATYHPRSQPSSPVRQGRLARIARSGLEEPGHPGRPEAMSRRSGEAPAPSARLRGSRCPPRFALLTAWRRARPAYLAEPPLQHGLRRWEPGLTRPIAEPALRARRR